MFNSSNGPRRAGLAVLATSALVCATFAGVGAASADADFAFDRIGAADRYGTSADVANFFDASADHVVLANGEPGNYADALSANYLAGELNAPVMLTKAASTPASVLAQLQRAGTTKITVVGGNSAVSSIQVASLTAAGYTVNRVSGATRFETNAEIIGSGNAADGNLGIVATGMDFPDALAGGPLSFNDHPLGLSTKTDIHDDVIAALKAAGVTKVLVLGGESAVGPQVLAKLSANGITSERVSGATRAATSVAVAEYAVANLGFSKTAANVASGNVAGGGADALAGGPLTGKAMRPLLVTSSVDNPSAEVLKYLDDNADTLTSGIIFGGKAAVSFAAEAQMEAAAQAVTPAPTTNQSYAVSPTGTTTKTVSVPGATDATVNQGNIKYTVGGLGTTPVYVALLKPSDIKTTDGMVSFLSTGTAGQADLTAPTSAKITVVNGVSTGGTGVSKTTSAITPENGSVSFTVDSSNPDAAIPVVFSAADSNAVLEIDSTTTSPTTFAKPKGDFGVGGEADWTAVASRSGNYDLPGTIAAGDLSQVTVTAVNTAAKTFQATYTRGDGTTAVAMSGTFTYGAASSSYQYIGTGGLNLSEAQFAANLSKGDVLNVNYNASGPSSFTFTKDAPAAPTAVTAAYNAATKKVNVSWTAPSNQNVTGYTVERFTVTNGVVGTTATPVPTTGAGTSVIDTPPASGSYQYKVTANTDVTSGPSVPASSNTVVVPAGADTEAPSVSSLIVSDNNAPAGNGTVDNGDQIAITFTEKVTVADTASITLRDNDGSVGTLTRGGNATMSLNSAGTTLFVNVTGTPVPEQAGTTLGISAVAGGAKVVNSTGVVDAATNDLAEVTAEVTPIVAGSTFTVTFNSPLAAASVTDSDFIVPAGNTVVSHALANGLNSSTVVVTVGTPVAAGASGYGVKAQSVANLDGGNGPAKNTVTP